MPCCCLKAAVMRLGLVALMCACALCISCARGAIVHILCSIYLTSPQTTNTTFISSALTFAANTTKTPKHPPTKNRNPNPSPKRRSSKSAVGRNHPPRNQRNLLPNPQPEQQVPRRARLARNSSILRYLPYHELCCHRLIEIRTCYAWSAVSSTAGGQVKIRKMME